MHVMLNYCTFCILQGDILDINEIFRDLATMVYEQGDLVGKKIILSSFGSVNFLSWYISLLGYITDREVLLTAFCSFGTKSSFEILYD